MYTWTHPVPNSSYYSAITEYILVLEFQNNETRVVLDANSTGLWVWQEYNTTYNISLQAKNCEHTEKGVVSLGLVSRNAFDICKSIFLKSFDNRLRGRWKAMDFLKRSIDSCGTNECL